MEQLVIDIKSDEDANLIKELLKRFKTVEFNSFTPNLSIVETKFRIQQGIKDADYGNVKDWNAVKTSLSNNIKTYKNN